MSTIQVKITASPELSDILVAELGEIQFDIFEDSESGVIAYCPEVDFSAEALTEIMSRYGLETYETNRIEKQNWNEVWESNYDPIRIEDLVLIRASFHPSEPGFQMEVVINPKMSFGTGHHATTWQMMKQMQQIDFNNKTVFDFGCGTGVLAILAEKLGATNIVAIDNDEICVENSLENVTNNHCKNIRVEKATAPPEEKKFDIILANINRHILLATMGTMAAALNNNGYLLISGFYAAEDELLIDAANSQQLQLQQSSERNQWSCLLFSKQA